MENRAQKEQQMSNLINSHRRRPLFFHYILCPFNVLTTPYSHLALISHSSQLNKAYPDNFLLIKFKERGVVKPVERIRLQRASSSRQF